jgi:hypothetical protein
MAMKLSVRALMITSALLSGGCLLMLGLFHLASPSYGVGFLQLVSSVYPGFHASRTFSDVLVGTVYALVDGAICGLLFGWLYNGFAAAGVTAPGPSEGVRRWTD